MKLSACNKDITPHKRGRTAFIVVALPLVFLILLSASCDEGGGGKNRSEPVAAVVERSRDANQTNDFLRLIFLPANVVPTTLGRPDALRVFVSVTSYFEPPLPLFKTADLFGILVGDTQRQLDVVALRCIPEEPVAVEPSLATWPRVFGLLASDLGGEFTCPPIPIRRKTSSFSTTERRESAETPLPAKR